jgi:isoquinoline 1-oxidoreductase subunit beta
VNRRGFLQVTATAAGGLLLGFSIACRDRRRGDPPAPAEAPAPAGDPVELNAWVRIDPDDTVTFLVPEAEMGQGVLTAFAMILAEELDADWTRVRAEHAPADAARYGRQSTGGSTSVRAGWAALRTVGAQARAMLVAAAAERLAVSAGDLAVADSAIVHAASGRRVRFGEVAADAARQVAPEAPALKAPERYHRVGRPTRRLDQRAKVTGEAVYGLDVRRPGMLVAQVARPPTIGGRIVRHDAAAALAVPGVRHVVEIPTGIAVVADHTWAAAQGRAALAIEADDGPHAELSSAEVSRRLAAAAPRGTVVRRDGDAARAIARARTRLRAAYEVPYLAHAAMEPLNATVHVEGDRCAIWTGTQAPSAVQQTAADILGIPPANVAVTTTFLGGGFGRRSQTDYVAEAVHVARAVGAPVQLVWTREDDTRGGQYRPAARSVLEGALDADGWPVAWVQRLAAPSILAQLRPLADGVDGTTVEGVKNLPYALPHVLVTAANVELPVTTWFWRSVGSSQNAWAVECFLDELARAGGKDPVEVRRRLLAAAPRHLAVLEAAARAAGWGEPPPAGRARGVAVHESFGSFVAQVAEVSIDGAGAAAAPRVHKVWCAIDCGRVVNPDTVVAQMESGIVYGLSAALHGAIRLEGGRVATSNFDDYPVVRMPEAPAVEVVILDSGEEPGGVGEPATPPIAPAVCNALLALTGRPVHALPIRLA